MKYKYPKYPIIAFSLMGVACVILLLSASSEPFTFGQWLASLGLIGISALGGWGIALWQATPFYRPVDAGVPHPELLSINTILFLNGETEVRFLGRDEDSGKFKIQVPPNSDHFALIAPWRLREYFSRDQEVFENK